VVVIAPRVLLEPPSTFISAASGGAKEVRSFGPALAAGEWTEFWIYIAGPIAGAALGAFAYQLVRGDGPSTAEEVDARV